MEISQLFEIIGYSLPAIITGGVAYLFFNHYFKNESKRRNFLLLKEKQKASLPIRLQAYERMALFLERISPAKLLLRVKPNGENPKNYELKLIQSVEQEFEHNLAQQIYLSDSSWNAITTAKNSLIQAIRTIGSEQEIKTANELREKIISSSIGKESPTNIALSLLKNEVRKQF